MPRLYVIRHGKTAHNADRRIQGQLLDDGLSPAGLAQAEALARRFERETLHAVYASPLKRAHETATLLAGACRAPLRTHRGLMEYSWGDYQGRVETPDLERELKVHLARWRAGELDLAPPGGESPRAAAARVVEATLAALGAHDAGETVAIVAHGRINKLLLATLVHGSPERMEEFPQSNTGVTLLEGGPGAWTVVYRDDKRHLATDEPAVGK